MLITVPAILDAPAVTALAEEVTRVVRDLPEVVVDLTSVQVVDPRAALAWFAPARAQTRRRRAAVRRLPGRH